MQRRVEVGFCGGVRVRVRRHPSVCVHVHEHDESQARAQTVAQVFDGIGKSLEGSPKGSTHELL